MKNNIQKLPKNGVPKQLIMLLTRSLAIVLLLALSLGIARVLVSTAPSASRSELHASVVTVRSVTTEPVQLARSWQAFGTARAIREANVAAEVAASVIDRPASVEEGRVLKAGDVIAVLDDRDFRDQASRSEQTIAALQADLASLDVDELSLGEQLGHAKRTCELLENELEKLTAAVSASGAARIEVDRTERQLTAARITRDSLAQQLNQILPRRARISAQITGEQAALRTAKLNIERATIRAPFAGTLQSVSVEAGERVSPGQVVARLIDTSRVEVPLRVPASASEKLTPGAPAEVFVPGASEDTVTKATLVRLSPEADAATRTIAAFIEVDAKDSLGASLRPGRFVKARVYARRFEPMIIVPRGALTSDSVLVAVPVPTDELEPYLVDKDAPGMIARVERRRIGLGFYTDGAHKSIHHTEQQWAAIEGGLGAGEVVIITHTDELTEGAIVRVVDINEQGAAEVADAEIEGAAS